jgi:hypothetical protein
MRLAWACEKNVPFSSAFQPPLSPPVQRWVGMLPTRLAFRRQQNFHDAATLKFGGSGGRGQTPQNKKERFFRTTRNRKTCVVRKSATCGHILHGDTLCRLAYPATPPHRHGVLCILLFWPCWLKQVLPATCVVPDTWFHVPPTSQSLSLSNGAALDPQGVGPTPEVEHCRFYACGHSQSAGTAKGAPWGRGATVAKCEEDFEGQDNAIAWLWGGGPLKIKFINKWERIRSCPLAPTCQSTCV